jgi:hypothetical protein
MSKNWLILLVIVITSAMFQGWAQEVPTSPENATLDENRASSTQSNDFRPLSGGQPISLGLGGPKQLDVSLNVNQLWTSYPVGGGNAANGSYPGWSFGGTLQLSLDKGSSQTILNYSGNGIDYPDRNPALLMYQNLGVSHSFKLGRWGFTLADAFNYSPNSPFGGYGIGLPGSAGSTQPVLNQQNVPNQSILTPYVNSYMNSVMGQVEYGITRRSSWTASGTYGFLRFPDSSLSNSNQLSASVGYNYALSEKDSIAVSNVFSRFQYPDLDFSFWSNAVQFSYSHQLKGRLALQLAGGPEITNTTNLALVQRAVQFSGTGSLLYSKGHTSMGISGVSGTTAGSGVLAGARTETAQFSVSQALSNTWSTTVAMGYAHNTGLVQGQQAYNTLFFSPNMRHAITRNIGVNFNYTYQRQLSSTGCAGLSCAALSGSFVTFGVDYRFRPRRFE